MMLESAHRFPTGGNFSILEIVEKKKNWSGLTRLCQLKQEILTAIYLNLASCHSIIPPKLVPRIAEESYHNVHDI